MSRILGVLILALVNVLGGPLMANELTVRLSDFRGNGGRVAWSPDGEFVVFDRKEPDGGFDLYVTRDFDSERCLTCNHPDLPNPKRNYGQPVVHPNGRHVVFQAEKQKHVFIVPLATNPGAGVFNDLWLYDLETDRATPLWEVPNDKQHGVLHPQFSKDGSQLSWSEMYEAIDFKHPGKMAGAWSLKVANFSGDGLSEVKEYRPGEDVIYENHGFTHDGESLLFSSNMSRSEPVNESTNIYRLHLATGELERLTEEGYNEHAHLSPDGKYIVWMSSVGNGDTYDYYKVGTDYWLMNLDGTGKRRLTHLNDPDHPHFRGRYAIAADFDFDPASSEENGYRLFAYLHELVFKNFGIRTTNKKARGEYNFFVDFSVDSESRGEDPEASDRPGLDDDDAPSLDDEFVDRRVVEGDYGFHFNVSGADLGMPNVVTHHEGDTMWCEAALNSPVPNREDDLYPRAPDRVTLVGITEDPPDRAFYQMMLIVEDKKGNVDGPFHWADAPGANFSLAGNRRDLQDWGNFVIQRLDERRKVVKTVTSNPLLWARLKDVDIGKDNPECSGTIRVDYQRECDIDPDANTSCIAHCKGTFRCWNLVQTGFVSPLNIYGDIDELKLVPTSVIGMFDLPLLWVNEDNEKYWRGNRVYDGEEPEDLPSLKFWIGGL